MKIHLGASKKAIKNVPTRGQKVYVHSYFASQNAFYFLFSVVSLVFYDSKQSFGSKKVPKIVPNPVPSTPVPVEEIQN